MKNQDEDFIEPTTNLASIDRKVIHSHRKGGNKKDENSTSCFTVAQLETIEEKAHSTLRQSTILGIF